MQKVFLILATSLLLSALFAHGQHILTPGQVVAGTTTPTELALFKIDQTAVVTLTGLDIVVSGCTGKVNIYTNNCAKGTECTYPTKQQHTGSVTISVNSTSQASVTALSICLAPVCSPSRVYTLAIEPAENGDRPVDFQIVLNTYSNNQYPTMYTHSTKLKLDLKTLDLSWEPATYCTEMDPTKIAKCKTDAPVPNAKYTVYYTTDATKTANLGTNCGTSHAQTFVTKISETKLPALKLEKNGQYWISVKVEGDNGFSNVYDAIYILNSSGGGGNPFELIKVLLIFAGIILVGCCAVICCIATIVILAVVVVKLVTKPAYTQVA